MFFGKLFYIQLLIALAWLCTTPAVVTRLLAKFLSMTVLEAPGAFSVATYTPRWCVYDGPPVASVYLCAPPRCRMCFVGIVFVFRQPPVTLESLTFIFSGALRFLFITLFSAAGAWGCAVFEAQLQCFFL